MKINLDVDNIGVLGLKQQRKRANWGQNLHENQSVQNSTKSMERYNMIWEILKFNLDVDNIGGLGFKITKKQGKLGAKFAWKFMCPELYQMQRKVKSSNMDYEN